MRKFILPLAGALGVFLAACLAAPGEPTDTATSALTCAANERMFNGGCHKTCTANAECTAPNACMTVSTGVSLCIDYSSCAYLGGDTTCSGVPYGGYGYESPDPYWTPSYDPYASSYSGYIAGPFGCGGNAVWVTSPPAAADNPKCGAEHTVVRCQKVGKSCSLVVGTTMDVAER